MSSLKRKDAPPGGSSAAKPKKARNDASATKSPKPEKSPKSDAKNHKPAKTASAKPQAAPAVSRLKEEEPLFPRGGGSILSPLEHKQIQIQAKQDVLFEQQSDQAKKKAEKGAKQKRTKDKSRAGQANRSQPDGDTVKIESLNYKRLVKGSLVLGQVVEINPLDLVVALPNNLVGHVPITAISETLNQRIAAEAAAEDGSDDDDDDGEDHENGVDLTSLFVVGQYIRAYVTSTMEESKATSGKSKKRIELSLRTEHTNGGLSAKDVVGNTTVMATVASVEDHGFVMDLGLEDAKTGGFLSRRELDNSISESRMQPGNILLCMASSKGSKGKIIQLTTQQKKVGNLQNAASEATTINTFLPGTAVELLVSEVSIRGLAGKVLGSLDATADLIHSGAGPLKIDLEEKYKVGKKVKARVICNFPTADEPKLGVSLLAHVTSLQSAESSNKSPLLVLPISSLVEKCTVTKVEPEIGVFVDVGVEGVPGFVHISRLKDGKVDMVSSSSGPFKLDSVHRGRVVGFNALDGVYQLSFEKSILETPYLTIEDVPIGEVLTCVVDKLVVGEDGINGLIVTLAEGITGFVPEMHLADVKLQHPEKKFREGMKVKARVLSTDPAKRKIRLTLKKTLINSEATPLQSFDDVKVGLQVPATIVNILPTGAVVQFYGALRGFLPIAEMSEAYIKDPKEFFRLGQVVDVHVLNFDAEAQKLYVSCKNPSAFGMDKQIALKNLKLGDVVSAKIVQKTEDHIFVELSDNSLRAMLPVGQLTDGTPKKNQSTLKKLYVNQTLDDLVVLDKNDGKRFIGLSKKPSLVQAAQDGQLLCSFDDAKIGEFRHGFVRNITVTAVFVQFAGAVIALLPKSKMPKNLQKQVSFGLEKNQSITVKISSIDRDHERIYVAHSEYQDEKAEGNAAPKTVISMENPVDASMDSSSDLVVGKVTKARIVSIKSTQLNVRLADNIQGRVDMSQIFDSWDEIDDPKAPLDKFERESIIPVRILGVHDARNHRFLPISHRSTHSVLELSAKSSDITKDALESLSYEDIKVGSTHLAFVNKVQDHSLWVNLSPNVRGRINALDISDDVTVLDNLSTNFPPGSALKVTVLAIDAAQNRLDLSAKPVSSAPVTWDSIKKNMTLPGRITKVNERQVMVQLSDIVSGPIHLTDISDDFAEANTLNHSKNVIVRVSVVDVDKSNKKVRLSTRHSRVLNSAAKVTDREISSVSQVSAGDILRGFVKNVSDKGLFIGLGGDVTAMVKISDLSDRFLKEWKDSFQVDQLVKGRVTFVDETLGQIQMSLKSSVVEKDYVPLLAYRDLITGQTVSGKVRKVEEFGAFIVVDGSQNVSGLCHRSEIAEKPVDDARKLLNEGDVVKAIILKLDKEKRRISFGLKPSYFEDEDSDSVAGAALDVDEDEVMEDDDDGGSAIITTGAELAVEDSNGEGDEDVEMADELADDNEGLDVGGFDWDADALDKRPSADSAGGDDASAQEKKKKRKKAQIEVDKSGDLEAFGPRTAADFEQLLNRQPNSSALWIQYMAYQMQSSELAEARKVAERAVTTINSAEETEKLNAWVAFLNLEVRFGSEDTMDDVFKRALQVNDQQEVYQRLATIYIQDKPEKADELFQTMVKKFGATSPEVWYNYGHWLHVSQKQDQRTRALLPRFTQALPPHAHLPLMVKFAGLQFNPANRNPELGRTMFENLFAQFPKRFDLWKQLLDHEDVPGADKAVVRDIFERALKTKALKVRAAKKWFKRWADWEEKNGDQKSRDKVSAKAAEWVKARAEAKAATAADEQEDDDDEE